MREMRFTVSSLFALRHSNIYRDREAIRQMAQQIAAWAKTQRAPRGKG
jgi:hypothetical protein